MIYTIMFGWNWWARKDSSRPKFYFFYHSKWWSRFLLFFIFFLRFSAMATKNKAKLWLAMSDWTYMHKIDRKWGSIISRIQSHQQEFVAMINLRYCNWLSTYTWNTSMEDKIRMWRIASNHSDSTLTHIRQQSRMKNNKRNSGGKRKGKNISWKFVIPLRHTRAVSGTIMHWHEYELNENNNNNHKIINGYRRAAQFNKWLWLCRTCARANKQLFKYYENTEAFNFCRTSYPISNNNKINSADYVCILFVCICSFIRWTGR